MMSAAILLYAPSPARDRTNVDDVFLAACITVASLMSSVCLPAQISLDPAATPSTFYFHMRSCPRTLRKQDPAIVTIAVRLVCKQEHAPMLLYIQRLTRNPQANFKSQAKLGHWCLPVCHELEQSSGAHEQGTQF